MSESALPLSEICDRYFGMSYPEARRAAALNQLPIPTFRLRDSRKAPLMVSAERLASLVSQADEAAAQEWVRSNT